METSVPARELTIDDINPLIRKAREHLSKKEEKKSQFQRDNWLQLLDSIYYASGGDYPDEESADVAHYYISRQLEKMSSIVLQLSYCDLQICIKDLESFKNEKIA